MENYFNYFTEIEECFRRCRGTPTLLSTLDWALVESWKEAGLPLEAVLAGIERSFEKFKKKRPRFKKVNSLAYCSQEVLRAADELLAAGAGGAERGRPAPGAPFPPDEIRNFLRRNRVALEQAARRALGNEAPVLGSDLDEAARALEGIAAGDGIGAQTDFEELERNLTALEGKLEASLTRGSSVELLAELRREVEREILPYRRKMNAAQIESLERQFLKKRLFEHFEVPRLSLFYL